MTLSNDKIVANVFPVGMQNSALTLYDDEGNSVNDVEELSCGSNEQAIIPSAINVEGSSDVIVGPVTQFHGPVTIHQIVNGRTQSLTNRLETNSQNGTLHKSEKPSSDPESHPNKLEKSSLQFFKRQKYILGVSMAAMLLVSLVITALILFYKSGNASNLPNLNDVEVTNYPENSADNVTDEFYGSGLIIDKKSWGGAPALSKRVLVHPTSYVIIAHTATPMCETFKDCSARVLNTQQFHVSSPPSCKDCPDIAYNFLIGGDGNAYVGRGWDTINAMGNNSIAISFIGNFLYHNLTSRMIQMLKQLLKEGIEKRKLSEDYKLIAHNQTYPTLSPGPHVYAVISELPHFYPGRVNLN